MGIVNHEFQETTYRVEAFLEEDKVGQTPPLVLGQGQKWEGTVSLVPRRVGERQKLEILPYREPAQEPYRTLRLWVEVRSIE